MDLYEKSVHTVVSVLKSISKYRETLASLYVEVKNTNLHVVKNSVVAYYWHTVAQNLIRFT